MGTTNVVLLDLRDGGEELPEVSGGVVVLDRASSLLEHAETYLSLVGEEMVTAVVCVAIGESATDNPLDGVVLAVPPSLRHATLVWVGDPSGVEWAPGATPPRPAEVEDAGFDGLIAALQVPEVFDRVVAAAGDLVGAAVSPGVRVVSGSADPVDLAEAWRVSVRALTTTDNQWTRDLGPTVRQLDAAGDPPGAVLGGPVAEAAKQANKRLDTVANLARELGGPRALVGSPRRTEYLGTEVEQAGTAAENLRRGLLTLLDRADRHLQVGDIPVERVGELGVRAPREARTGEIVGGLRQVVDGRLDEGASLPLLAQELRLAGATSGPQGCQRALDELRRPGPLALDMPVFRRWPLHLATIPLAVLTCAVVTFLLYHWDPDRPTWVAVLGGGLLALVWAGAGWLLLARRPAEKAEVGLGPAASPGLLGYGLPAVLGVVIGFWLASDVAFLLLSSTRRWLLLVGAILVTVACVVLSWYTAVRRWRAALRVGELRDLVGQLTRVTEDAVAREWQPLRRRRAVAAAAVEAANGLDEIGRTLAKPGLYPFAAPPRRAGRLDEGVARAVPQELLAVVRADLVDLCRGALEPGWAAAQSGRRTEVGVYEERLKVLLEGYARHVRTQGLLSVPAFSRDPGPRHRLTARTWANSPRAQIAIETTADGEMTQLCRSGQIRYLSTVADPALVRFAPQQVLRVFEQDGIHQQLVGDSGVAWTAGGELVGALRLLPLRLESVAVVSPTGGMR